MNLDLTFRQVCELVKKDGKADSQLIDAVDKLLGFALICSPLVIGPAAAALLPTLAVKNELIKLGKGVFDKVTNRKDVDYLERQERMQMGHGLLVFTSFFDALDAEIPAILRDKIGLLQNEKMFLAKDAAAKGGSRLKAVADTCDPVEAPIASMRLSFPHPTESLTQQLQRHANLWKEMGNGFHQFIQKLAFWEEAGDKDRSQILAALTKVPDEAGKRFEAQYFELARKFEDFAVWSNLQEHKGTKALIGELSEYVKQHADLSKTGAAAIDIGFAKLHAVVANIPEALKIRQADDLVESLSKHYLARAADPIIEGKDDGEGGGPTLSFPLVCDAFIPQAFRVLRQSGTTRRLEDEETWQDLPRRNDLGAFLLSYLSSPYSTESPLLILGHPGSGKSLLTTILSTQLMSRHFTAIRVQLRSVNADASIVSQIEESIRRITNISVDSWAKLSSAFTNNPPLVILDGYDELLQASGKVFSGYLKDVQTFQKNEAEQGRPVRVIVTSRVTLIDKATVPSGATILRLLEFDRAQQERWAAIWNRANINYFRDAKIRQFALPDKDDPGAEKVLALAEQPLLLLMLALYDSRSNELRTSKALDRTKLYDSLLRRFVTREKSKEKEFGDFKVSDKKKALDVEMHRLGVSSLGMYNRRKVHILASELNDDLKFFESEQVIKATTGRVMSQADLLLGSFFFIHKSKAKNTAGAAATHEEASAFEFLHNTFGEFLTADFILRRAFAEVEALQAFQDNDALREDLEKRLNSADGFKREWFASLVYTPLFTRPVVLEMMREWVGHILKERQMSRARFVASLDVIILNQIKRLLTKREMPSIIRKDTAQEGYRAPFDGHPLLGHIAIYSINLILLRVIVGDSPFVFDESQIATHEDGARPWDRLTHIWRSWFSLDNLNGVTAVLLASRTDIQITVRAKEKFQVAESEHRLETCRSVAVALGDGISSGLTGLLLFDSSHGSRSELQGIRDQLHAEHINLDLQIGIKQLFQSGRDPGDIDVPEFVSTVRRTFELALQHDSAEELEYACLGVRSGLMKVKGRHGHPQWGTRPIREAFREAVDPRLAGEIAMRDPQAALSLWRLAKEISDWEWIQRFGGDLLDRLFHPRFSMEMSRDSEAWTERLRLIRKVSAGRFLDPHRFEREFDPRRLFELTEFSPESALAMLQLVREFGGRRFLRHFGDRLMNHEFVKDMLNPSRLLTANEGNLEAVLATIQLLRELGDEHFVERYRMELLDLEFVRRELDPRRLLELSEVNPEAALTLLQLARELGDDWRGGRRGGVVDAEFVYQALDPRRLLDLCESNPDAALASIRLVREFLIEGSADLRSRPDLPPELVERALEPRRLLELLERNPEVALSLVQLSREFGGAEFVQPFEKEPFTREFFDLVLDPYRLIELTERDPEAALVVLQVAREFSPAQLRSGLRVERFESLFGSSWGSRLMRTKPAALAVILRIVSWSEQSDLTTLALQSVSAALQWPGAGASLLERLPLSSLPDLQWFAEMGIENDARTLVRNFLRNNGF